MHGNFMLRNFIVSTIFLLNLRGMEFLQNVVWPRVQRGIDIRRNTKHVTLNTEIRYLIRRKKITTYVKGENLTNFLEYNKMQNARIDETKIFYFDEVSERAENVKE